MVAHPPDAKKKKAFRSVSPKSLQDDELNFFPGGFIV
jgi:hypothetical protein